MPADSIGSVMVALTGPSVGLADETTQSMVSPGPAVVVLPVRTTVPDLSSGDVWAAAGVVGVTIASAAMAVAIMHIRAAHRCAAERGRVGDGGRAERRSASRFRSS